MVKRCAWGQCTADDRYPDKLNGSYFLPFPKPKTQLEKCLRWIRACGRPHNQLNVELINKHRFVCSRVRIRITSKQFLSICSLRMYVCVQVCGGGGGGGDGRGGQRWSNCSMHDSSVIELF